MTAATSARARARDMPYCCILARNILMIFIQEKNQRQSSGDVNVLGCGKMCCKTFPLHNSIIFKLLHDGTCFQNCLEYHGEFSFYFFAFPTFI